MDKQPTVLPLLGEHFLAAVCERENVRKRFKLAALDKLAPYRWPGNVRELRNVVQRAFVMAEAKQITDKWLPSALVVRPVSWRPAMPSLQFPSSLARQWRRWSGNSISPRGISTRSTRSRQPPSPSPDSSFISHVDQPSQGRMGLDSEEGARQKPRSSTARIHETGRRQAVPTDDARAGSRASLVSASEANHARNRMREACFVAARAVDRWMAQVLLQRPARRAALLPPGLGVVHGAWQCVHLKLLC
jgi:hypothetical protein